MFAPVQLVAPGNESPTKDEYNKLNRVIKRMRGTADVGLRFFRFDLATFNLVLFTYASLANARGIKSKLGFLLCMGDSSGDANIVHYGSNRF